MFRYLVKTIIARLRHRPGFVLAAALSLGLGMALATSVFSIVDGLYLQRLPFLRSDRLVAIRTLTPSGKAAQTIGAGPALAAHTGSQSFAGVAVWTGETHIVGPSGDARSYETARVTSNLFEVLGVRPALGRLFGSRAAAPGDERAIVISSGLWQTRFGSDSGIIGKRALVDGSPRVIIGVVPPGLEFPPGTPLWTLLPDDSLRSASHVAAWFLAVGRLKEGVSRAAASSELSVLFSRAEADAGVRVPQRASVQPVSSLLSDEARESMALWIAAALLIVILCAVNLATMMLASGMRRRGELAVRAALGASGRRITVLLLSEAGAIALLGGLAASVFTLWMLGAERRAFDSSVLSAFGSFGWRTLIFALGATALVGALFSLAPAIELARTDLRPLLSGGASGTGGSPRELRSRRGLVALQIGLALACVCVVTSVVIADARQWRRGPGFAYENVLIGSIRANPNAWSEAGLIATLRAVPGVERAAIRRNREIARFWPEGKNAGDFSGLIWSDVSPEYFTAMGLLAVAGRLPMADDVSAGTPVMVLPRSIGPLLRYGQESVARVAQRIWFTTTAPRARDRRTILAPVVGVVEDVHIAGDFWREFPPIYTVNALATPGPGAQVVVRVRGDRREGLERVREALKAYDSRIIISDLHAVYDEVARERDAAAGRLAFLTSVGVLSLVLALIGVYGLVSYTTELRMREIGIRVALGATDRRVVGAVVGDLWWMAGVGSVFGVLLGGRLVLMVDTMVRNPLLPPHLTLAVVPALVGAVALGVVAAVGTFVPVRRALRMDVARVITA